MYFYKIGISGDIWDPDQEIRNGVSQCVKTGKYHLNQESWHVCNEKIILSKLILTDQVATLCEATRCIRILEGYIELILIRFLPYDVLYERTNKKFRLLKCWERNILVINFNIFTTNRSTMRKENLKLTLNVNDLFFWLCVFLI